MMGTLHRVEQEAVSSQRPANATENIGGAKSWVFVAWQALVDGYAPKPSNDPAIALQAILETPKRCKDAKELTERLTAWSLKVAEYEHQFKTIDEAQKIFVVREMMPKVTEQEFLTGPRKLDEGMEKLEIIDQCQWTWGMSGCTTRRRRHVM